jgi:hypothetical protein
MVEALDQECQSHGNTQKNALGQDDFWLNQPKNINLIVSKVL